MYGTRTPIVLTPPPSLPSSPRFLPLPPLPVPPSTYPSLSLYLSEPIYLYLSLRKGAGLQMEA